MGSEHNTKFIKNRWIYIGLLSYLILALFTMLYFDGTGDAGDSVHHYLFARYAPVHPELYFNHWAKPLFVLLASPFAQFGFIGMKVFNVLTTLFTLYFTYKIAEKSGLKHGALNVVFFIFAPVTFALTFSGLTEPLFALFISIGVYLAILNKWIASAIIISFLPFIRSEGLIICGVFAFYFLLKSNWKSLPFLLLGHVAYSFAGYFVHKDLFWVFTKIPYAHLSSTYGNGRLLHFVDQLAFVIGIPIYLLLVAGFIAIAWKSIKKKVSLEIQLLIGLSFLAFFVAHSLFWYLGIFNSMGLKRVFVGVMPLISIIALIGFNFMTEELLKTKTVQKIAQSVLLLFIAIFPFTSNPAALHIDKDLKLSKDQQLALHVSQYVKRELGMNHRFIFAHPYLSLALTIDHFDPKVHVELDQTILEFGKKGDVIIWDSWFSVVENGVTREYLDGQKSLQCVYTETVQDDGREITYAVYRKLSH